MYAYADRTVVHQSTDDSICLEVTTSFVEATNFAGGSWDSHQLDVPR